MVRRVFLACLVLGVTACGDDGVSLEDAIIGTWELVSITGDDVTFEPSTSTWTFTATTLTIVATSADCTIVSTYILVDGTVTFTVTTVNGSDCEENVIGDVFTATVTVSADTLTLVSSDFFGTTTVTGVFKKVN